MDYTVWYQQDGRWVQSAATRFLADAEAAMARWGVAYIAHKGSIIQGRGFDWAPGHSDISVVWPIDSGRLVELPEPTPDLQLHELKRIRKLLKQVVKNTNLDAGAVEL